MQENKELHGFQFLAINVSEYNALKKPCTLRMVSNNMKDNIQFIRDEFNYKRLCLPVYNKTIWEAYR